MRSRTNPSSGYEQSYPGFYNKNLLPARPYDHVLGPQADPWGPSPLIPPHSANLAAGLREDTRQLPTLEQLRADQQFLRVTGRVSMDQTGFTRPVGVHASHEVAPDVPHVPRHARPDVNP